MEMPRLESMMNRHRPFLVFALALGILFGTMTEFAAAEAPPTSGRILVSFEPGTQISVDKSAGVPRTGLSSLDAVLDRHSALSLEPLFGAMIEMFDDPTTREDLARHYILEHADKAGDTGLNTELQALAMVEEAMTDVPIKAQGTAYLPNDLHSAQWYLRNTTVGGGDTRALGGWAESLGDTNVVVAVLDSGVDWHHPDLGGPHPDKVNGAMWTNWTEYYGTAGVDDDGNGYVDDFRGWDYVGLPAESLWPGEDPGPPDNDPMDFHGHGTAVAGCISPITDNGIGIAGIAPGCKIMAVRIGYAADEGGVYGLMSYMAQGFVYATANGADIINLSYGTVYYSAFASAVQAALDAGLVICVSAMNENNDVAGYLQALGDDRILTVAASTNSDIKSDFSSYGTWVDVTAPGSGIYTTAFNHQTGESTYASVQGTSFASPITAGACALILSAEPGFNSAQVAALIQDSCDNIDHLNPGFGGRLGAGRINIQKALGDNIQQYPAEYPTLFDAINCAGEGDTVKVESTVIVNEPLALHDRGIKLFGGYDASYETRDLKNAPTVITGNLSTSSLSFQGDVQTNTEVDGFRITGGGGTVFGGIPYFASYGGGVILNGHSPTLRNLDITGNTVGDVSTLGCGGGIMINGSSPVLENVSIHGNSGIHGAGLFAFESSPTLIGCDISDNIIITSNGANPPLGGGMHVVDSDLTMTDCVVSGHFEVTHGGGMYVGAYNTTSNIVMTGGEISGNTVT
jgi:subtilisin family serine protease